MDNQKFSVIIRVKNEERYIGFCIQSILDHLENSQIIVINNKSNDDSLNIISHFKKDATLKSMDKRYSDIEIVDIDKYTPGKALNMGIAKAINKYILIISAHCKLVKFNHELTLKHLNKGNAIFGNQVPIWNGKRIKKRYIWSNFKDNLSENYYSENEERFFFHNAFSMFQKNTLIKFPFNENLVSKEDRYWANSFIDSSNKIMYLPDNVVEHYYTSNGSTWKNL